VEFTAAAHGFANANLPKGKAKDTLTFECKSFGDAQLFSVEVAIEMQTIAVPVWAWDPPKDTGLPTCVTPSQDLKWESKFKHQVAHETLPLIGVANDGLLDERRQKTAKAEADGAAHSHDTADNRGAERGIVGGYKPMNSGLTEKQAANPKNVLDKSWRSVARRSSVEWEEGGKVKKKDVDDGKYIKSIQVDKKTPDEVTVVLTIPAITGEFGKLTACWIPDDGYNYYEPLCASVFVIEKMDDCKKVSEGEKEEEAPASGPAPKSQTTRRRPSLVLVVLLLLVLSAWCLTGLSSEP